LNGGFNFYGGKKIMGGTIYIELLQSEGVIEDLSAGTILAAL
jgi:hypothetical protein